MATHALVSILCPDDLGLIAAITGHLNDDLGANLADTTFAVLGGGAEFTAVCEMPDEVTPDRAEASLRSLPLLAGAEIQVTPFELQPVHGPTGRITHRIVLRGGDRPGLIARLSEIFIQFNANIVRLNAEKVADPDGGDYIIRLAVSIPEKSVQSCLAAVTSVAGQLRMSCSYRVASEAVAPPRG